MNGTCGVEAKSSKFSHGQCVPHRHPSQSHSTFVVWRNPRYNGELLFYPAISVQMIDNCGVFSVNVVAEDLEVDKRLSLCSCWLRHGYHGSEVTAKQHCLSGLLACFQSSPHRSLHLGFGCYGGIQ